jgi:hypothetical protein
VIRELNPVRISLKMLSLLLRPKKKVRRVQEQFSSPATHGEQSAPAKYGRERAEVRYAAADWTETDENDEETEEEGSNGGLEEEQVEQHHLGGEDDDHEDGDEETPLLPIFSAAHLGTIFIQYYLHLDKANYYRCNTGLSSNTCDSNDCPSSKRNNLDVGPTAVSASITIPRETYAATDSNSTLLSSDSICLDGELPTVWEGSTNKSSKRW